MSKEYGFHPLAEMFPAMSDAELAELAKDIEQNGQLHPIRVIGDQIIDGCNRYRACQIVGVEPVVEEYEGSTDEEILIRFVMSCNINRRQLTSSQRAMLAAELLPRLEAAAKERQRAAGGDHGNQYTKVAVPAQMQEPPNGEDENNQLAESVPAQMHEPINGGDENSQTNQANPTSAEQAAEIMGTSPRYVSHAKYVREHHPGLAALVRSGEKTLSAAIKEIKQAEEPEEDEEEDVPPVLHITLPKKGCALHEFIMLAANIDNDESLPEEIPVVFVNGKELGYELSGAGA